MRGFVQREGRWVEQGLRRGPGLRRWPRVREQGVSGAGCGEGEREVSGGRQRAQSPLSGNLAGEGNGAEERRSRGRQGRGKAVFVCV